MRCSNIGPRGARNWFRVLDSPRQLLSPNHPDVLLAFRHRSPADSAADSSAPLWSCSPPPALISEHLIRNQLVGGFQVGVSGFGCVMKVRFFSELGFIGGHFP